jgi:hypothetical protein
MIQNRLNKKQVNNILKFLDTPGNVVNMYYFYDYHHSIIKIGELYYSYGITPGQRGKGVSDFERMKNGMLHAKRFTFTLQHKHNSLNPFKY